MNDWQLEKQAFADAIELPPHVRYDYLEKALPDNQQRQRVWELVQAHFSDRDFLQGPWQGPAECGTMDDPLIGKKAGPFVLQELVGRGGMGSVYRARQDQPARDVAVKLLRRDCFLSSAAERRFKNESQILASLHHPGITHVYDSGTLFDSGTERHWFAMEWINGDTLMQHVYRTKPSTRERVELLVSICRAIEHAHQQDVVHRDLKPANILVRHDSNPPSPAILDFGIARSLQSQLDDLTLTATHDVLGTLDYLSPEQVASDSGQISPASDVFAIGVIGFEMLTGQLPFDRRAGSIVDAIQRVRFSEPRQLSSLDAHFSPDLSRILEKSMRTDSGQRYADAGELADDLDRWLNQRPIHARRLSTTYRLKKYLVRNRILVGGAATTILALLLALAIYARSATQANQLARAATEEANRANYEADKATTISSYITNDLLVNLLNQIKTEGNYDRDSIAELVTASTTRIGTIYAGRPLQEAAVRNELGTIFYNLQDFKLADQQYRQALELWENELGPNHPDTLKAVSNLGQSQLAGGVTDETESLCLRAYESRKNVLGLREPATLNSLNNLAELYRRQGKMGSAEALFVEGMAAHDENYGEGHRTWLTLAANLGSLYLRAGKLDQAIALQRRAHQRSLQIFGPKNKLTLQTGIRLAQTLDQADQFEEAMDVLSPIVPEYESMAQADPGVLVIPYRLLARIQRHQNKTADASETLNRLKSKLPADDPKFETALAKIKRDLERLAAEPE